MAPSLWSGSLSALWVGVVAGGVEVTWRAYERFVLGKIVFVGPDFWWLAPLVTALVVTIPTVLVAALLPSRASALRPHIVYGVPVALASLGLVLLIPRIAPSAAAILAIGIGVRVGMSLNTHATGYVRLVRRTLPVLLLVPALGGTLLQGRRFMREFSLGGDGSMENAPNVLLLVLDTVRAIELGLYGFARATSPNLDALAREGIVFDQAFATASWTAPSHASLFTGRRAHELSIDWEQRLDDSFPTLAEALRRRGYATVGIVGNTRYAGAHTGLARGFARYEDYRLSARHILQMTRLSREALKLWSVLRGQPISEESERVAAPDVNARFLRWLDRRHNAPYFAFLNYYDAHAPYLPPEPFWNRFLGDVPQSSMSVEPGRASAASIALRRSAYDGAIAYLDHEIGALFDALITRGALDNTMVIITADHGEEFSEHGMTGHGHSLYAPSVRVPLIFVWPGRLPSALRIGEPISLSQVPATIMDLVGGPGTFPGPSMSYLWKGGAPPEPTASTSALTYARNLPVNYPVSRGSLASARLGRYRYIRTGSDSIGELYDHAVDPMETRNLVAEPLLAPILRQLRDTVGRVMPAHR